MNNFSYICNTTNLTIENCYILNVTMPKKKSTTNNYFNQEVEDALCQFIHSDDRMERERLFAIIYPALCKIAEVWYHKTKFSYSDDTVEDVMADCVAHLVEKLPMFNCGKGTKAFSYFTVTARFFYIILSNKNYTHFKRYIPISDMGENWDVLNNDSEDAAKSETAKLFYGFLCYCEYNFDKIFIPRYRPFARAVLDTLSNFEDLEGFKKKTILHGIYKNAKIDNEYGKGVITKVIGVMSSHLTLFSRRWNTGNESLELCVKKHLTETEKEIVNNTIVRGVANNGTSKLARQFGVEVNVLVDYLKST